MSCPRSLQARPAASSKLTTYGSWAARSPCQLCQCRTSGVHCSLSPKARCTLCQQRRPFPKQPSTTALSLPSFQLCMPHAVLTPQPPARPQKGKGKRTDELGKPPNGQAAGSRDELQQPDPLLIVHLLDNLQSTRQADVVSTLDPSTDLSRSTQHTQTPVRDLQRCFLEGHL